MICKSLCEQLQNQLLYISPTNDSACFNYFILPPWIKVFGILAPFSSLILDYNQPWSVRTKQLPLAAGEKHLRSAERGLKSKLKYVVYGKPVNSFGRHSCIKWKPECLSTETYTCLARILMQNLITAPPHMCMDVSVVDCARTHKLGCAYVSSHKCTLTTPPLWKMQMHTCSPLIHIHSQRPPTQIHSSTETTKL